MIFWIFVSILVIGIVLAIIGLDKYMDSLVCTGAIAVGIGVIAMLFMLGAICCNHLGVDAYVAEQQELYTAIRYKVESGACRDEFGLLNKAVVDEIQDWNTELRYHQNVQDDFWIGIFYPNIYDQFEYIEYAYSIE